MKLPDGAVIGVVGTGSRAWLRAAVEPGARLLGPEDPLDLSPTKLLLLDHALAMREPLERALAVQEIEALRRAGSTVLLAAADDELLGQICDEIWVIESGAPAKKGAPAEILRARRVAVSRELRELGEGVRATVKPAMRRGDGRAQIESVELLGESGAPSIVWRSGELAVVRVGARFRDRVDDPVIGMLIRSRIGLNVYGTNTELEALKLGPCAAGECLRVSFAFRCELCPGDYTVTVASHDPDGVWHEWLEDAVAFSVTDVRYTAGVANLRATATLEKT